MKKSIMPVIIIILLACIMASCQSKEEWEDVTYSNERMCDNIGTECLTEHQGEHEVQKCKAYMDNDTLIIDFPPELPAYWGHLTIKVHNGKFNAQFDGVPFDFVTLSYETVGQELSLKKIHYAVNDTLCGYCNFKFKEINPAAEDYTTFNFQGTICEIIRGNGFNPLSDENIITYDLRTAIHELGEPLHQETITTDDVSEFRTGLLNHFAAGNDIKVEEVTWNVSDDRDISDAGIERLTVWYVYAKDKAHHLNGSVSLPPIWQDAAQDSLRQLPVTFSKWNTNK